MLASGSRQVAHCQTSQIWAMRSMRLRLRCTAARAMLTQHMHTCLTASQVPETTFPVA